MPVTPNEIFDAVWKLQKKRLMTWCSRAWPKGWIPWQCSRKA